MFPHRPMSPVLSAAAPVLLSLAVLSLTACQNGEGPQSASREAPAARPARAERVITGNATYLEPLQLPPDSVLVVQLIDTGAADGATPAVLSHVRLVNVRGPSIPFALPYDPDEIDGDGQYGLRAQLTNALGGVLFATDSTVAVEPGHADPIEFRMLPVGDAPAQQASHWQCGPLRVDARVNQSDNTIALAFSGRALQLPMAISGAGERFADEQGNEFWMKGETARLTLEGEAQPECVPAEQPSPWTEAAARDVAFRAVGNEPGWWVEVGRGEAPALRAVLDYGEREIEVTHAQPAGLGFVGETADGVAVELQIVREPCRDGMSGERFEASAQLTVGDSSYQGCGAFLSDATAL